MGQNLPAIFIIKKQYNAFILKETTVEVLETQVIAYRDETERIHSEIRYDVHNLVFSDELKLSDKQNPNILIIFKQCWVWRVESYVAIFIPPLLKTVRAHGPIARPSLLFQLWTRPNGSDSQFYLYGDENLVNKKD